MMGRDGGCCLVGTWAELRVEAGWICKASKLLGHCCVVNLRRSSLVCRHHRQQHANHHSPPTLLPCVMCVSLLAPHVSCHGSVTNTAHPTPARGPVVSWAAWHWRHSCTLTGCNHHSRPSAPRAQPNSDRRLCSLTGVDWSPLKSLLCSLLPRETASHSAAAALLCLCPLTTSTLFPCISPGVTPYRSTLPPSSLSFTSPLAGVKSWTAKPPARPIYLLIRIPTHHPSDRQQLRCCTTTRTYTGSLSIHIAIPEQLLPSPVA